MCNTAILEVLFQNNCFCLVVSILKLLNIMKLRCVRGYQYAREDVASGAIVV